MKIEKRNYIFILWFVLTAMVVVFYNRVIGELSDTGNVHWSANYICKNAAIALGMGTIIGIIVFVLFIFVDMKSDKLFGSEDKVTGKSKKHFELLLFLCSLLLCFVAFLPFFLAYFPRICSYDTDAQLRQIIESNYVEHHPLAHTLLLRFF